MKRLSYMNGSFVNPGFRFEKGVRMTFHSDFWLNHGGGFRPAEDNNPVWKFCYYEKDAHFQSDNMRKDGTRLMLWNVTVGNLWFYEEPVLKYMIKI